MVMERSVMLVSRNTGDDIEADTDGDGKVCYAGKKKYRR